MSLLLRRGMGGAGKIVCVQRPFSTMTRCMEKAKIQEPEKIQKTDFSKLRDTYETPHNPIVLAHGLFGFDEFRLAGNLLPGVEYWRGIREALQLKKIEVIVTSVPPSGSIEARAARLAESIEEKAGGRSVNIIAGLDSRYMISQLKPSSVKVMSLTTIATPHRGSGFADYVFDTIGPQHAPRIFKAMESVGLETGAFTQLTRKYMTKTFNPKTPDLDSVRYYSYGASLEPAHFSVFRASHDIIKRLENAPNDGLVSVPSSKWGEYKGTITGVSHLDLINWTSRVKHWFRVLTGTPAHFDGTALYLHIADMLAKQGL
ncbi:alpha/beta-hydrolase [Microthyrium microscopicum]|uniref:Alpha/beta-hydrolase n=1 Tax=Microthyrium microscopicum TaxID=703497 RepID=A0A6A6U980_9PEZI|nr:alpha/beta-hydrolase [Microthyrium microscopicum]